MSMGNSDNSGDNIPLGFVQIIWGNFERRNVRSASSCARSKHDDSGTTVVNDFNSSKFLMIGLMIMMTIMMRMMAAPSQGQEMTIF